MLLGQTLLHLFALIDIADLLCHEKHLAALIENGKAAHLDMTNMGIVFFTHQRLSAAEDL